MQEPKVSITLNAKQISMLLGCLYETKPIIDASELELWSETNALVEDAENEIYLIESWDGNPSVR